jgi:hypothetical protein
VGKSLAQLGVDKFGIVQGSGVDRDSSSGLVRGFVPRPRRMSLASYSHNAVPAGSIVMRTTQHVGVDSVT